jgi:hypothetical protein
MHKSSTKCDASQQVNLLAILPRDRLGIPRDLQFYLGITWVFQEITEGTLPGSHGGDWNVCNKTAISCPKRYNTELEIVCMVCAIFEARDTFLVLLAPSYLSAVGTNV